MPEYVTASALAVHLGCSRVTIGDYVTRKVFERLPNGKFDQDDCRLKAFAYLRDKSGGRTGGGESNLSEARAELTREQTAAVALKNAVARAEFGRVATIMKGAEVIFATFRERILAIPGKIASSCEMRSRGEVEEVLRNELHEALDELSKPILTAADLVGGDSDDSGGMGESSLGGEGAAETLPD